MPERAFIGNWIRADNFVHAADTVVVDFFVYRFDFFIESGTLVRGYAEIVLDAALDKCDEPTHCFALERAGVLVAAVAGEFGNFGKPFFGVFFINFFHIVVVTAFLGFDGIRRVAIHRFVRTARPRFFVAFFENVVLERGEGIVDHGVNIALDGVRFRPTPFDGAAVDERVHLVGDKLDADEHTRRIFVQALEIAAEALRQIARVIVDILDEVALIDDLFGRDILYFLDVVVIVANAVRDLVTFDTRDFLLHVAFGIMREERATCEHTRRDDYA